MKIGISLLKGYDRPITEVVDIVKTAGFEAVSPQWTDDVCEIIEYAKMQGLDIQSLHGPYAYSVGMWRNDPEKWAHGKAELCEAIDVCRRYGIPTMVTHIWLGFDYTFGETKYGLDNYSAVVEYARERGVRIAFENTEGDEYLDALMEYFKDDDTVGFCWDSGHENAYNRKDLLALYGDRLIMTHLNDNMGMTGERIFWTDDLHMLPYDGTVDWDDAVSRLKKAKPQDILNFELKFSRYTDISYEEYFSEAYKRAKNITELYLL